MEINVEFELTNILKREIARELYFQEFGVYLPEQEFEEKYNQAGENGANMIIIEMIQTDKEAI